MVLVSKGCHGCQSCQAWTSIFPAIGENRLILATLDRIIEYILQDFAGMWDGLKMSSSDVF
jgi:hypothetical protein